MCGRGPRKLGALDIKVRYEIDIHSLDLIRRSFNVVRSPNGMSPRSQPNTLRVTHLVDGFAGLSGNCTVACDLTSK